MFRLYATGEDLIGGYSARELDLASKVGMVLIFEIPA